MATIEPGRVTRALLTTAYDVTNDRSLAALICMACVDGLDIDGASISLLTATSSGQTLWSSDATAELLEDLQFTLNEGACIDAATTGHPVLVPDLGDNIDTSRWSMFAAAAAEYAQVSALFAFPLQWSATNVGVLNLYRRTPGALSDEECRDALAATDLAASMMVALLTEPSDHPRLDPHVGNNAEIHQATGMMLVQLEVSAADALARMRGHAFVEQRLLIDVARDVVARRLSFTPDTI